MKYKLITLSLAAIFAGCTSAAMKPIKEGVGKVDNEATVATAALRTGKPLEEAPKKTTHIKHVSKVWLPVQKVEASLPALAIKQLARNVAVNRRFTSLNDATSYITALTGVPATSAVTAAQLMAASGMQGGMQGGMGGMPGQGGVMGGMPGGSMMGMVPGIPSAGGMNQQSMLALNAMNSSLLIVYNGQLSGLYDLVAARYNVSWEWDADGVRFYKVKSKTFRVAALPGNTSLKSTIGTQTSGNSSSGASGTSGSSVNGTSTLEAGTEFTGMSVWTGIEEGIKTMLSADGKLIATPATGTITVTDTPHILERVSKYIDDQNASLSRQVVINVKVLSVDLSDSDEYGINWNAVYNNLNRSLGFTLSNAIAPSAGATNMTMKVLSGSMWDGTTAMIDALSRQGKVSQLTSASMVTLNNQPAPMQVGRQTSYLASSQTTIGTAGSGNTTTLQPGVIVTGFSMNMIPHILDNSKLMLQYSGDISSLIKIDTATSGNSSIQTPEVDTRNFLQRVIMNGGETLVVTGFEQFNLNGTTQGVGDAENIAVGGGVKTRKGKSVIVVLIQPVLSGS